MKIKDTYNDNLDPMDQLDMEELIASKIFDDFQNDSMEGFCEEDCARVSRDILLEVLKKFRPDLIKKGII